MNSSSDCKGVGRRNCSKAVTPYLEVHSYLRPTDTSIRINTSAAILEQKYLNLQGAAACSHSRVPELAVIRRSEQLMLATRLCHGSHLRNTDPIGIYLEEKAVYWVK